MPEAIGARSKSRDEALANASFGWSVRNTVLPGKPNLSGAITHSAAEAVARPDAQFYNDTLSLLEYTRDPQALSVMLDQPRDPTSSSALRGTAGKQG